MVFVRSAFIPATASSGSPTINKAPRCACRRAASFAWNVANGIGSTPELPAMVAMYSIRRAMCDPGPPTNSKPRLRGIFSISLPTAASCSIVPNIGTACLLILDAVARGAFEGPREPFFSTRRKDRKRLLGSLWRGHDPAQIGEMNSRPARTIDQRLRRELTNLRQGVGDRIDGFFSEEAQPSAIEPLARFRPEQSRTRQLGIYAVALPKHELEAEPTGKGRCARNDEVVAIFKRSAGSAPRPGASRTPRSGLCTTYPPQCSV